MAPFNSKQGLVEIRNNQRRPAGVDGNHCSIITMMTARLGRRGRGAPSLVSLYKPKNNQHQLARAQLFEQSAVDCFNRPVRGEQMSVRQALHFIKYQCESLKLPQDIWHGLFEEQYKRSNCDDLSLFTEEFLMVYVNSLEAVFSVLETESAIAMFAEDEQVSAEALMLRLHFPFADAVEQQDLINKSVQKEIDYDGRWSRFNKFRFFKSLSTPSTRRLLEVEHKLRLFGHRNCLKGVFYNSDPFYSAKIFRRTLDQAHSWFFAERDRRNALPRGELLFDEARIMLNPPGWTFYEENAVCAIQ